MYRYLTKKKGLCLLFSALLFVSCVGGTFFSLVMSALIDCAGKGMEELLATLLGSIVYVVVYIIFSISYYYVKEKVLTDARYFLKRDIFTGVMNRSVAEFDAGSSGEYINELSNHINLFETVYFANIIKAFQCLLSFGSATAICIVVQPLMLILMIALAFLTMGVTRLAAKPLEQSMKHFTDSMEEYTAEIKDDLEGFRLIHSFGILPHILKKHDKKNRDECTANLDAKTAEEIEESVSGVQDCLIIAVTHHLEWEGKRRYDQVLVLGGGKMEIG